MDYDIHGRAIHVAKLSLKHPFVYVISGALPNRSGDGVQGKLYHLL